MSYFEGLSQTSQNLIMLNFEFLGKKLLLGIALVFSFYYIFFYWKNKKDTPYYLLGIAKLMLYICSWIYFVSFPMMIFFLYPQVELDQILIFMLIFYSVGYTVLGAIVLLNILWHGTNILASFAGIKSDPKSERVKKNILIELIKMMGFKGKKYE